MPTHKILADLDVGGEVKGTSLDLNGNAQIDGTVTVGVDDTGYDVKFFGATSSRFLQWDESEDYLLFRDNTKGVFGNGADLKLYHDASNSYIENATGTLYIMARANDADISFQCDDGSGGDAEYFKLDGSLAGGDGAGTLFTIWADNSRIGLGANADLRMYHDGSHSQVINLTGNLTFDQRVDDGDIIFKSDDGSGGVATYLTLDGGISSLVAYRDILLATDGANGNLKLGAGQDLVLNHDGTDSKITNSTGDLYITNSADDKDIIFQSDNGSGGTATYFFLDGSATQTTFQYNTRHNDSVEARFGDSNDLRIFHDATDSTIRNYVGDLKIINSQDDGDIKFQCDDGSGGLDTYLMLDGSVGYTQAYKNIRYRDNVKADFGDGGDLDIYHDGNNSYISQGTTGDLYIRQTRDDGDIFFQCDDGSGGNATYITLDGSDSSIKIGKELQINGDSRKLKLGASGDLEMFHNGTDSTINNATGDLYIKNEADDKDIILQSDDGSGGTTAYLTLDGSSAKVLVSRPSIFYDTIEMASYIYHNGDTNSYFGFSAADTFNLHVGGAEVLRVNGGSTTDEAAVSILCGGGTNVENIALLLKGDTNGEALKLKIQNPNNGGTLTGAGILSYEPDADTFNIGQSTTHANMAISIDNSENVTLAAALTVTGNITANGNIIGDDSTNITNINRVEADAYAADADSTTTINMGASSIDCLVEDTDVFQVTSSAFTFDAAIKTSIKKRKLAKTTNTDGNADGDIVYFGSTTSMDTGKIYYLNSSGNWALADADAESTAKGMLGVALGAASDTNGVLIRGMVTLDHDPGTVGHTLFLHTTAGQATITAPSGSGDIVRVIGYLLDSTNGQIYFNPDGAFVEVA